MGPYERGLMRRLQDQIDRLEEGLEDLEEPGELLTRLGEIRQSVVRLQATAPPARGAVAIGFGPKELALFAPGVGRRRPDVH